MINMFWSLFRTRIKVLLRQKTVIFWTLIFPLALGTFFNLAFSNLNSSEAFKAPKVAVADTNDDFKEYLKLLSNDQNKVIELSILTENDAKTKLENKTIAGYYTSDPITMVIGANGVDQTVMKVVLDQYYQMSNMISTLSKTHPEALQAGVLAEMQKETNYITDDSNKNMDVTVIYFYTLMGMVCMYAGFFGISAVNESEANLSVRGARINVSPTHKLKSLIANILAGWVIQYTELLILLGYLLFVLHVDFGNQIWYILLLILFGSLAGISAGILFGAWSKKDEDSKITIFVSLSMVLSFLAGMMIVTMKYIISEAFPLLNYINPVSLITDGLYSLYYYTDLTRYWTNILYLTIFSIVMIALSYLALRRKKYDSI